RPGSPGSPRRWPRKRARRRIDLGPANIQFIEQRSDIAKASNIMIKRFHALCVGQIELDNIGRDGTPANDRRYSNERLSEVFEASRQIARVMDETGYYCLWAAEHHFQREGYECIPNLMQWGLWLATHA